MEGRQVNWRLITFLRDENYKESKEVDVGSEVSGEKSPKTNNVKWVRPRVRIPLQVYYCYERITSESNW